MPKPALGATLEAIAERLPDAARGIACKGTKLESTTFTTGGKAFLFVGADHARFKLAASIAEAKAAGLAVGAGGWTRLELAAPAPPRDQLARWITESRALVAPNPKPKRKTTKRRR